MPLLAIRFTTGAALASVIFLSSDVQTEEQDQTRLQPVRVCSRKMALHQEHVRRSVSGLRRQVSPRNLIVIYIFIYQFNLP